MTNNLDEYEDLQDMIEKVNMETLQGSPWFLFLLASKPRKKLIDLFLKIKIIIFITTNKI